MKQKYHFHRLRELFASKTLNCLNRRITEKSQRSRVQKLLKIQLTEGSCGSLGDTETLKGNLTDIYMNDLPPTP